MANSLVLSGGMLYRDDGASIRLAGSGVIEFVVGDVYESQAAEAALAAIKAKTDSLTFTVAGHIDANIQYVNDVAVKGVGSESDPWNPA
jgi:phage gp45-like